MESILNSIKKDLGIDESDKAFDSDITRRINSAFMVLAQLGVCPDGFRIVNEYDTWDKFFRGRTDIDGAKDYVYLKVRLVFDPPTNASLLDALKEEIKELESRLNMQVDTHKT